MQGRSRPRPANLSVLVAVAHQARGRVAPPLVGRRLVMPRSVRGRSGNVDPPTATTRAAGQPLGRRGCIGYATSAFSLPDLDHGGSLGDRALAPLRLFRQVAPMSEAPSFANPI